MTWKRLHLLAHTHDTQVKAKLSLKGCTDISCLTSDEIEEARTRWEIFVQSEHFSSLKNMIDNNKANPLILQLGLYLDDNGIIRCKGRFQNTNLPVDTKHPKLFPKNCYFQLSYYSVSVNFQALVLLFQPGFQ